MNEMIFTNISFFLVLVFVITNTSGSRIIFNGMHASDSHVGSMLPLATRFLEDGHYVHVLESHTKPNPFKFPAGINYTYIRLRDDPVFAKTILPQLWQVSYSPRDFSSVWKTGDNALVEMHNEHIEELKSVTEQNWDLVIADELFATSSHALALLNKKRSKPFIVLTTCVPTHIMLWRFALGSTFFHRPSMFHPVGKPFDIGTFSSRLHASYQAMWIHLDTGVTAAHFATQGLKLMGIEKYSPALLAQQTSYYFIDDVNQFVWPYPVSSEVVNIGNHCHSVKQLPDEYKTFVEDDSSKGTILIAFGSNAKWEYAPEQIVNAFIDAVNNLTDFRIVFTYNGPFERVKRINSHCKITKWAPQKEILAHPKTKLFVSHGGMKSFKDTVCAGVPVLYMPLFAEQTHNAEMARSAGFAEILIKTKVTAQVLTSSILNIIENPVYQRAVERFREIFLDHLIHPLDLAAFKVKRAVKTGDKYPTFKRKGMYMSMLQYSFIDLFCVFITLLVILIN